MPYSYHNHNDNEYDTFYGPTGRREAQPRQENSFYSSAAPRQEPPVIDIQPSVSHKKRNRTIAAILAGVLVVGGAFGLGYGANRFINTTDTDIYLSSRQPVEVNQVAVDGKTLMTYSELYQAVVNSCVSINASATSNIFGQQATTMASAGSGFIITKDGYIVTNYHVIEGSDTVSVTMYDGTVLNAQVIGGDKEFDIAVIKVEPETELEPVVIGKSGELVVGDDIAAIGNPLGELSFSMSEGIVSTTERWINVDGTPFNMIQITAAVNSGNSGGPLFNRYGEVVGIVSAKLSGNSSSSATVEGLGFAIPMDDVVTMIDDIIQNGYITNKPYLAVTGQTFSQQMNPGVPADGGLYIYSVETGGAADRAGIQPGDVIVKIGEEDIGSLQDVEALRKTYKAGDTVDVVFYRGAEEMTTQLTFDAMPETTEDTTTTQTQTSGDGYSGNGGYMDPWEFFDYYFNP